HESHTSPLYCPERYSTPSYSSSFSTLFGGLTEKIFRRLIPDTTFQRKRRSCHEASTDGMGFFCCLLLPTVSLSRKRTAGHAISLARGTAPFLSPATPPAPGFFPAANR